MTNVHWRALRALIEQFNAGQEQPLFLPDNPVDEEETRRAVLDLVKVGMLSPGTTHTSVYLTEPTKVAARTIRAHQSALDHTMNCPVCGDVARAGLSREGADRTTIDCANCGAFGHCASVGRAEYPEALMDRMWLSLCQGQALLITSVELKKL